MSSVSEYSVFKVLNPLRAGEQALRAIVDTNGDGRPSDGDYGVTADGETVCLQIHGTLRYQSTDQTRSWAWVNARHRFQARAQIPFYGTSPSRLIMGIEEAVLAVPHYLAPQYRKAKSLAKNLVGEAPVLSAAAAAALVGAALYVRSHPAGRVAEGLELAAAAGAAVSAPLFVRDQVEAYHPAVQAWRRGEIVQAQNILLQNPIGQHDFLYVPGMIAGAPALTRSAAQAVNGIEWGAARFLQWWQGGNRFPPALAGVYGGIRTFAVPAEAVAAAGAGTDATAGLWGVPVFLSRAQGSGDPAASVIQLDEELMNETQAVFGAYDQNTVFEEAFFRFFNLEPRPGWTPPSTLVGRYPVQNPYYRRWFIFQLRLLGIRFHPDSGTLVKSSLQSVLQSGRRLADAPTPAPGFGYELCSPNGVLTERGRQILEILLRIFE